MSNKRTNSNRQPKQGKQASVQHRVEQFSGPVPHPDLLKKYDEALPGLAERLVSLAEKTTEAEIYLKTRALTLKEQEINSQARQEKQEHTDYRLGILVAILVVAFFLMVAVFAVIKDAPAVAISVVTALAGIIWAVKRSAR
ncbi:MAG: DUF2335 domain-containing protein [Venatoribacter sp.]